MNIQSLKYLFFYFVAVSPSWAADKEGTFLPSLYPEKSRAIDASDIQGALTSLFTKIAQAQTSMETTARLVKLYKESNNLSRGNKRFLDYWSFQLKNKTFLLLTLTQQMSELIQEIDEANVAHTKLSNRKVPIENVEQEGAIIHKMMSKFLTSISQAQIAGYYLDKWIESLEKKATEGQAISSKVPKWNTYLSEEEYSLDELNVFYQSLVAKLQNIDKIAKNRP